MKNIVCHGLGETPKQWESVLRQIPTKVECPELFNFVQEKVFTYQKLYKAFERYCDSESELLNLCGLSLGVFCAELRIMPLREGKVTCFNWNTL